MATFGSKRDRDGAGKPVAMPAAPEPGLGTALLVDSVRCATVHLFAAFRKSWRSSPAVSPPPGRAVILPGRLPLQRGRRKCWRSLPASDRHPGAQPPDFRAAVPRLSRGVTPSLQLIGVLPGAPSGRSPTESHARPDGTPLVSGRAACCGRERRRSSTQASRHAGAAARLRAVGRSHILESAKLTFVAAAPRMPSGRAAGAAATPGVRSEGNLRPPPRGGGS